MRWKKSTKNMTISEKELMITLLKLADYSIIGCCSEKMHRPNSYPGIEKLKIRMYIHLMIDNLLF